VVIQLHEHPKKTHLALFFKDFAAWVRSSCVGLNVAGFTTAKYLEQQGINVCVYPVRDNIDIVYAIDKYNENHSERLTHVVISAPWLSVYDLKNLILNFSDIHFVILSHSNVGFLQADPYGVELFRKYAQLSKEYKNLQVGGNSIRFVEWFATAYKEKAVLLPNLYPVQRVKGKIWDGVSALKIGAFGAIRPEKNFMTAAAAALVIHSILNVPMELHMSTGGEGCQSTTLPAISQMMNGISDVFLVKHDWDNWDKFIKLIEKMDLLIQVSYTESFNMITADGISVGVPSVVSPVIFWAPDLWKADADNAIDVAKVGIDLLINPKDYIGSDALLKHNQDSLKYWLQFLS
jgi:hypothetical protein